MVEMTPIGTRLPDIAVGDHLRLRPGRAHEFCGMARRRLAAMVGGRMTGPVLWIRLCWVPERLNPDGLRPLMDPARLILAEPRDPRDLLWCMEEGLRSGAVPLVVAELPEPPAMTPVRRLHLAAETGMQAAGAAPLGLLLTPGQGGAAGVESRWSLNPAHAPGRAGWRLERLRARMAPPAGWDLAA